jgi:GGDEF domain-containing protein
LVTEDPNIRFYAGQPLSLSQGMRLGTLCAIDNKPRTLSVREAAIMKDLARMVEAEFLTITQTQARIEIMAQIDAMAIQDVLDPVTRLRNNLAIQAVVNQTWQQAVEQKTAFAVAQIEIRDARDKGLATPRILTDTVISAMSRRMMKALSVRDVMGRLENGRFMVVSAGGSVQSMAMLLQKMQYEVESEPLPTLVGPITMLFHAGVVAIAPTVADTMATFIAALDQALAAAQQGVNHIHIAA